jgi:hypothetical protein
MVAHVGDFGLAKFVFEASHNPSKNQTMSDFSVVLKGSIGYIPLGMFQPVTWLKFDTAKHEQERSSQSSNF